jgi:hypothetical protein
VILVLIADDHTVARTTLETMLHETERSMSDLPRAFTARKSKGWSWP